jgi:hypothetical protein
MPAAAQELFPRFSVTGGMYRGNFATDVRADSAAQPFQGTQVNAERDLGLEPSKNLRRFTLQWRPFERHEFAGSYFSAARAGFREINGPILFRGQLYPAQAQVSTNIGLKYWDATYTGWLRRSDRTGLGLTLGGAGLSIDATLLARRPGQTLAITETASTNVPVVLIGVQGRLALTLRLFAEAQAAALPRVRIDVYSGRAAMANIRFEYRIVRNLGLGAAYNYFRIDGTVADPQFGGRLAMTIDGGEGYLRIAFGR